MNKIVLIGMSFMVMFFSACSGKQLDPNRAIEVSNGSVNKTSTIVVGTTLGTFWGAVIGYRDDGVKGAKKGAVIGGTVGCVAGVAVANSNQEQATQEHNLGKNISGYSLKQNGVF